MEEKKPNCLVTIVLEYDNSCNYELCVCDYFVTFIFSKLLYTYTFFIHYKETRILL